MFNLYAAFKGLLIEVSIITLNRDPWAFKVELANLEF